MRTEIDSIICQLKDVQHARLWVGANFDSKLSLVEADEVFLRPLPDLHSVAEIISHLTAWRKDAIFKIKTGKGRLTEEREENWLPNETLQKQGWDSIKRRYDETLAELIELLKDKDDSFLKEQYYDTDFKGERDHGFVVYGMLHHDIYHLGQLGIIIKFLKSRPSN